jgi:predicted SAM-dependent methyltransferase
MAGATAVQGDRRLTEAARLRSVRLDQLNFGCGQFPLPGWTNIDNGDGVNWTAPQLEGVIHLDVFEALEELPPGCARFITSEHFFEHFTLEDGHRIIGGWFAALAPGGVLRIVMPDLEREARLYLRQLHVADDAAVDYHRRSWLNTRYAFQPREQLTRAMVLNFGMRLDGHKFFYDLETITQSLRLAGFEGIVRREFGESEHPELAGIDQHDGGATGRPFVTKLALVVEATRPA